MKKLRLQPILSDKETDNLLGTFITPNYIKHHINNDTEVYNEKDELLCVFKKNAVSKKILDDSRFAFRKSSTKTNNRGMAGGDLSKLYKVGDRLEGRIIGAINGTRYQAKLNDGTLSKTSHALPVNSGIIGFSDRYPRIPYCRTTAFTQKYFKEFTSTIPYIKEVNKFFAEYATKQYKIQKAFAENTSKDFVIEDTAFTTVTVNKNFQTACHRDAGDLKEGFGNLGVLSRGKYEGYITVIPKYGVGLDLDDGDLALFDVHEVHGNTAPKKITYYERISIVCYYREKMLYCGSKQYELDRAKSDTKKVALPDEIAKANKIKNKILN